MTGIRPKLFAKDNRAEDNRNMPAKSDTVSAGSRFLAWFETSPIIIPAILIVGLLVHIVLMLLSSGLTPYTTEMHQVAVTLARTGVIANAYQIDGIPTTHVGPIAAAPAALVYAVFGVDSRTSEAILTACALLFLCANMLLLDRLFKLLGERPVARRLGMAAFMFIPVYLEMEVRDFRIREGGVAAMVLAFLLLSLVRLDRSGTVRPRDLLGLSALMAFLALLSPSVAVPGYAACGVFTMRCFRPAQWPIVAVVGLGTLAIASAPWAVRNHQLLGEWVWSRGNTGLELAVGTHAGAVDPVDPLMTFVKRLDDIHPYKTQAAYHRMQVAGGELAYARAMGSETMAWSKAHPVDAARIGIRHVGQFYLPPRWLWSAYGTYLFAQTGRFLWMMAIVPVALFTLLTFLVRRRWLYLYLAAILATAVVPYVLAQPRTRYSYPIGAIIVFLAASGAVRSASWLGNRRKPELT